MLIALPLTILASLFAICVMVGWVRLELRESSARIHQWWPTRAFLITNAAILGLVVVICLGVRRAGPKGLRFVAISISTVTGAANDVLWVLVAMAADPYAAMAAYVAPFAIVPIGSAIGLGVVVWKLPS